MRGQCLPLFLEGEETFELGWGAIPQHGMAAFSVIRLRRRRYGSSDRQGSALLPQLAVPPVGHEDDTAGFSKVIIVFPAHSRPSHRWCLCVL